MPDSLSWVWVPHQGPQTLLPCQSCPFVPMSSHLSACWVNRRPSTRKWFMRECPRLRCLGGSHSFWQLPISVLVTLWTGCVPVSLLPDWPSPCPQHGWAARVHSSSFREGYVAPQKNQGNKGSGRMARTRLKQRAAAREPCSLALGLSAHAHLSPRR